MLAGVYIQVIRGEVVGNSAAHNGALLTATAFSLMVTVFVLSIRLDTEIRSDGIYVRMFPIQFSYKVITWATVGRCYLRTYKPIAEYGGWGMRWGLGGKGMAYTISGNQGLQVEYSPNKKLLIGTQKPEELERIIQQFRIQ